MAGQRSIFEEVGTGVSASRQGSGGMIDTPTKGARGAIRVWLAVIFLMVAAMILVGGLTRLTDSGLSITEWRPVMGALPPMNDADWQAEFAKYQQSPQAQLMNAQMDVGEPLAGKTLWTHDDRWSILEASIVLAVHHRTGELLDGAATRAIALHEVGHLIGLDHTTDTTSIMTPRVRVKTLSPADRATARLLYLLPPGPIGTTRAVSR